YIYI
ncbi:hypothetical protein TIFTF001_009499, partial [Ficus carica]